MKRLASAAGILAVLVLVSGECGGEVDSAASAADTQASERRIAYPANVTAMPQLRGVMLPSGNSKEDDFKTLHDWGATIVRYQMTGSRKTWGDLSPDRDVAKIAELYRKWLDGRLDHLEKVVLPMARKYGMKVCVDLHDAPGHRYKESVGDASPGRVNEFRMYRMEEYRDVFYESWRKIASRFRGDPSIYGFDLINEPVQNGDVPVGFMAIQEEAAKIIREIDPATTIIVEVDQMDCPDGFKTMKPIGLDNVIYQVHMYVPFLFTHQAVAIDRDWKIRAEYPDAGRGWDKMYLRKCLRQVREFEKRHGARIYVGEFSAPAWAKGAGIYLRDCIEVFNEYGWDWSYHAFREWEGWSVEHEWPDRFNTKPVPSTDNPRLRALKNGLRGKENDDAAKMGASMMNPGSALRTVERIGGGGFKVLVYGNSIAIHEPNASIGWTNNWGMAASAPERDFVHLVVAGLEAKHGKKADYRMRNIAVLERNFTANVSTVAEIAADVKWRPDYVVVAIGENAKGVDKSTAAAYQKFLADIARPFADGGARVVMRSPFWQNPVKAESTAKAAAEVGAAYVDAGPLGGKAENKAIGLFSHSGVANHPGDLGMKRLADLILKGLK